MKRIKYALATMLLVMALSVPILQQGVAMANTTAGPLVTSVSAQFTVGKSQKLIPVRPYGPCPVPGADC